jgi:CheY-like chemotaxis protein
VAPTLLLADDSVTIQRVIELTFADEDVNVVAVSDGEEAIAVLERTPPDIVLADVGMPGRSGYEVAQHIKDSPRLAHIPVVLLTGAFEPIDRAKAAAAGCDGVLAKPFEPQLVIGRVRELLSKPKGASIDRPLAAPAPEAASWGGSPSTDSKPSHATDRTAAGDYFDTLDRAFANLSAQSGGSRPPPGAKPLDWFTSQHDEPAGPPAAETPSDPPAPTLPNAPAEHPAPRPAPPPTLPPLADAFAALLAAEQASPTPPAAPLWPALPPPPTAVSDEMVEKIVRRVLDELTDHVVRESIVERVDQIAERLVREQIERAKGSSK